MAQRIPRDNPGLSGPVQDGRMLRAQRSRSAAVDALLASLARGEVPSTKAIAAAAGITERTLFNLFEDKHGLLLAAVRRYREQALARLPAVPSEGPLEQRIHAFVSELAPFLDEYAAVRWAAITCGEAVPDLERGALQQALLRRLQGIMSDVGQRPPEGDGMSGLKALIDPLTWRQLRTHQRLGRERAASAYAHMLLAMVSAPSPGRAPTGRNRCR